MLPRFPSIVAVLAASLAVAAAAPSPAGAQQVVAAAGQRTDLSLTVYQGGFALVHDVRAVTLPAGAATVVLPELSDRLDIGTIRLAAGRSTDVASVVLEREVLSREALLRRAVGGRVRVAFVNPATGEDTIERAEVLAVEQGVVLRIGDRIETDFPGRIIFDDAPADLRPAPTIVARLTTPAAGEDALSLSYLSDGIDWTTSYVGRLAAGAERMELTAWALVDNQTGMRFPAARLALVAGEVNRAAVKPMPRPPVARTLQAEAAVDVVAAQPSGPYYRYALPERFEIRPRQQTQVTLFRARSVPVARTLRSQGGPLFDARAVNAPQPVTARLTVANDAAAGLGLPMPAGQFSVFAAADGGDVFQGGAFVEATPAGADLDIDLGQAFDVTLRRTVVDFRRYGARNENVETTQRLKLTNAGSRPAEVDIVETFRGEWRIVSETVAHTPLSAFQALWRLTVPSGGEASLEYRAQITQR